MLVHERRNALHRIGATIDDLKERIEKNQGHWPNNTAELLPKLISAEEEQIAILREYYSDTLKACQKRKDAAAIKRTERDISLMEFQFSKRMKEYQTRLQLLTTQPGHIARLNIQC